MYQTILRCTFKTIFFQIAVGCSKSFNVCDSQIPVRLLFNKKAGSDVWYEVVPLCIPNHNRRLDCEPNVYHAASEYTADAFPSWTRVTISLPEKTFSRFGVLRNVADSLSRQFSNRLLSKQVFIIMNKKKVLFFLKFIFSCLFC